LSSVEVACGVPVAITVTPAWGTPVSFSTRPCIRVSESAWLPAGVWYKTMTFSLISNCSGCDLNTTVRNSWMERSWADTVTGFDAFSIGSVYTNTYSVCCSTAAMTDDNGTAVPSRSEERRVGKEGRSRRTGDQEYRNRVR